MPLDFAPGDAVNVTYLDQDTGFVDGVPIAQLINPGEVVEASEYPPGMTPNGNPSPHYKVRLGDGAGNSHDAWFAGPRLVAI